MAIIDTDGKPIPVDKVTKKIFDALHKKSHRDYKHKSTKNLRQLFLDGWLVKKAINKQEAQWMESKENIMQEIIGHVINPAILLAMQKYADKETAALKEKYNQALTMLDNAANLAHEQDKMLYEMAVMLENINILNQDSRQSEEIDKVLDKYAQHKSKYGKQ